MRGAVRDVLRAYVAASDDDYRLRCAPERYRMRVFRDFAKDVGDIAEAGARVNFVTMPDFLNGVGEALKVIIEVGNRMQGICRWYPPTTAGRSRRRRWLQGCEEAHQASVASSLKYTGRKPSLQQVMTLPGSFIHPPP